MADRPARDTRKEKKASVPESNARVRPGSQDTAAAKTISVLTNGSDEQRQDILDGLSSLSPEAQADLRERLKEEIVRGSRGKSAGRYAGYLISALARIAGNDAAAVDVLIQQLYDSNQWVRYWALAQLYQIKGGAEAARYATRSTEDSSGLVRELAQAIVRTAKGAVLSAGALDSKDPNIVERLRALQVVGTPADANQLVAFLLSRLSGQLRYETLRALTANVETTKAAARILANIATPNDLVAIVMEGSTGASARHVARFAGLFGMYPRETIEPLLRGALRRKGSDGTIAAQLLDAVRFGDQPPTTSPVTIPPGAWRAELAYRSVLQRPGTFELLESLSATQLAAVLQQAGVSTEGVAADKLADLARSLAPGGPPNPLWLAWIRNVHGARLTQD